MNFRLSDYANVQARAHELGLPAVADFAILPRAFDSASPGAFLAHENDASTIRKLIQSEGVAVQQVQRTDQNLPVVVENSADWVAPVFFVSSMLLSQNQAAVQVALNVVASYLFEFFRGRATQPAPNVRLSIVVERAKSKECVRVDYEGPVSGIGELPDVLSEVHDGRR